MAISPPSAATAASRRSSATAASATATDSAAAAATDSDITTHGQRGPGQRDPARAVRAPLADGTTAAAATAPSAASVPFVFPYSVGAPPDDMTPGNVSRNAPPTPSATSRGTRSLVASLRPCGRARTAPRQHPSSASTGSGRAPGRPADATSVHPPSAATMTEPGEVPRRRTVVDGRVGVRSRRRRHPSPG